MLRAHDPFVMTILKKKFLRYMHKWKGGERVGCHITRQDNRQTETPLSLCVGMRASSGEGAVMKEEIKMRKRTEVR